MILEISAAETDEYDYHRVGNITDDILALDRTHREAHYRHGGDGERCRQAGES